MKMIDLAGAPSREEKAREYFVSYAAQLASHVDRMMACLLAAEWLGSIVVALAISPRTWSGSQSHLHPHVWIALLLGPAIVCGPIALALLYPARIFTRHVIAIAQISMSILLIDITGGRIETHFHVFGSLAFLAFYRDWRVLITASALTALDHLVRGIWWPQSVYGMLTVSPWRWVEHAWWVIFEDFFLILSCRRSIREMWAMATREAQLSYGAYYDVLTGLANRRLLEHQFDRTFANAGASGRKGAILFLDLDRFKHVNDTLGHTIGDKLLAQVSERLSSVLHADTTLARVGGDEFVVVVENLSCASEAEEIGGKLLGTFNLPFTVEDHHLLLSASVGISLFPEHGDDLPSLQEAADVAMYEAKAEGRNRCALFSPEMTTRGQTRQELARDLYHAIPRRELELYYQPQIGLDGQVSGFEALLRWTHRTRGSIPPSEFIPLAEKSGLIVELGDWVLRQASKSCGKWQQAGYKNLKVAVNVSAIQFEEHSFSDRVAGILAESRIDPSLLVIELTESALLKNVNLAKEHLSKLRSMGIEIALDDFGTGYSSLSYLQDLPADTIKLDRTFVTREYSERPAMLESIIGMAHNIGLSVVAEGVETTPQIEFLRAIACDQIQGYYYSRPMPSESVVQYLESHAAAHQLAACV